jgi:flavodoxin
MASESLLGADKRVLLCWFSGTGQTKRVVDVVAGRIRAELYEIKGDVEYKGWTGFLKSVWRSARQKPDNVVSRLPEVSAYDVFVIACPVWGWKAPQLIQAFVKAVNFDGKPVIPLSTCQSNATGFLESFTSAVNNGRVLPKEGFFGVNKLSDEQLAAKVTVWLDGI